MFDPEYVNIFGVPFTFLPHEGGEGTPPPPPSHKTQIEQVKEKRQYQISWPNILRIDHVYTPVLTLDLAKVPVLEIHAYETATLAELAPVIDGKPDVSTVTEIDLEELGRKFRMQKLTFHAARDVYDQVKPSWQGNREFLLAQLIGLAETFLRSDRVQISPPLFHQDELRRRVLLTLNMNKVVQHICEAVRQENTEKLVPVFDSSYPIRSTSDMRTWYTGRPCEYTKRSHINFCVYDSTWEASEAFTLDRDPNVDAWVKNGHLGLEILYVYKGVVRKCRPDFLVRLAGGKMLVVEVKGKDSQQDKTKRRFLAEWCQAVNEYGGFGTWESDVSFAMDDLPEILSRYAK